MDTAQDIQNQDINTQTKEIRHRVFALRNGEVAAQMKQGGVDYGKNYGLLMPQLRAIAADYPRSFDLSEALLDVDAREYRLLSLMLFPLDATVEQLTARAAQLLFDEEAEVFALATTPKMEVALPWAQSQLNGSTPAVPLLAAVTTLFRIVGKIAVAERRQIAADLTSIAISTASVARMVGKLLATLALVDDPEEESRYREALAAVTATADLRPVVEHYFREEMGE